MTPLVALLVRARVHTDVPVDPDGPTGRSWAEQELADPIYHQRESLLDAALRWLAERWADAQGAVRGLDARTAAVVLGTLLVVGLLVAFVVAGPVRRARRAGRTSVELFIDDSRTAVELRASADVHAAAGRWSDAVLDRFRAILRALEERAVVDERPGRTADEAAAEAGAVLPDHADGLRDASRLFDDVCYGDARATAQDDARLRALDDAVQQARPAPRTTTPEGLLVAPR